MNAYSTLAVALIWLHELLQKLVYVLYSQLYNTFLHTYIVWYYHRTMLRTTICLLEMLQCLGFAALLFADWPKPGSHQIFPAIIKRCGAFIQDFDREKKSFMCYLYLPWHCARETPWFVSVALNNLIYFRFLQTLSSHPCYKVFLIDKNLRVHTLYAYQCSFQGQKWSYLSASSFATSLFSADLQMISRFCTR